MFDPHHRIVRWTARHKQAMVEAFQAGKITADELWTIHGISNVELAEWVRRNNSGGRKRLRVCATR
jgi:hypothetical protein